MMARSTSLSDASLEVARDRWDARLRQLGHRMRWQKAAARRRGRPKYYGTCKRCGGQIMCHTLGSSVDRGDIRRFRCAGRGGR